MEAGMGGRSDATASLPGIMTLITPVSLDHAAWLGSTVADIAIEKGAIAEPNTPVIVGRQPAEVRQALDDYYRQRGMTPFWCDDTVSVVRHPDGTIDYHGAEMELKGLTPGLPGRYQADNAALALAAAEILNRSGVPIDGAALQSGIAAARWPGRLETVPGSPPLLLDGAHNAAGAAALVEALADYRYARLLLVVGVMADKDVQEIVSPLASLATTCYCVTPAVERALDAAELARMIAAPGRPAHACGPVGSGIEAARRDAAPDDLILVCGSLFTVGEAKAWLAGTHFEGIRG
jgi:dihydrofolate synthase/folylpolyglutamate synthase